MDRYQCRTDVPRCGAWSRGLERVESGNTVEGAKNARAQSEVGLVIGSGGLLARFECERHRLIDGACHVNHPDPQASDLQLMRRCIALARSGRSEYPFAAVVGRRGKFICEASDMVRRDTCRHGRVVGGPACAPARSMTAHSIRRSNPRLLFSVPRCRRWFCRLHAFVERQCGGRKRSGLSRLTLRRYPRGSRSR